MTVRRVLVLVSVPLFAALVVPACSEATRHRVLSYFIDGVPEPGVTPMRGYAPVTTADAEEQAGTAQGRRATLVYYSHPPYRENRCGACHNPRTGELFRTPQDGLCGGCHTDVPGDARYVHGPVVVADCLFCHHFHASLYPKVLLTDATATCFRCHRRVDLTEGPHHETVDDQACVECHNPHGGNDRFFLKRSEH